jgi:ribonuclease J
MSKGEHRYLNLGAKDLVVVNATPIPGNEKLVSHTINRLFARGCEVIYEADKDVHVSGHASREELKIVLSMVRPKYFVPIHGEYRMLVRHAQLAEEVGVASKNAFVLQAGEVLSISASGARQKETVPSGAVLVDGMALGEMEGSLLRERHDLSEDGIFMISLVVDRRFRLVAPPLVESQGTIHLQDARELRQDVENAVMAAVESVAQNRDRSVESLSQQVRNRVRSAMRNHVRSTPVIVPLVSVLSEGDA